MRRVVVLLCWMAVASLLAAPAPAAADETYICWYERADGNGVGDATLTCRINGSIIVTFPSTPPVVTVPEMGFDATGPCWYRRTGAWSGWILVQVFPNRDARMWWSPSLDPAGPFVGDGVYRACVSEPRPTPPPFTAVWDFIARYPFARPSPALAPASSGITGLATYVAIDPPEPVRATISSPLGGTIDVELSVAVVRIDWGDGVRSVLPPETWDTLTGYPDGEVHHTYERRGRYDMTVSYDWYVRWRIGSGPWQPVSVRPTTWSTQYRVDELVGRRTA